MYNSIVKAKIEAKERQQKEMSDKFVQICNDYAKRQKESFQKTEKQFVAKYKLTADGKKIIKENVRLTLSCPIQIKD